MDAENRVFGETKIQQQAAAMTILRHVRDAEFFSLSRVELGNVSTLECDRS